MLIVLSPAKKINENKQSFTDCSTPLFIDEAEKLIKSLRKYNPAKLSKLMSISSGIAELNYERYLNWNIDHSSNTTPAALSFNGEAYSGLDAALFSSKEMNYAQNHLRILSGLYGVLKPFDLIHAYRLEMGTNLKVGTKKNLYEFWGDKIVNEVNDTLKTQKENVLVNLASNEYFKAINKKKLEGEIITPVFKDFNNGKYKIVMVYAKKARGMMTSFIIKNKIEKKEDLKAFDISGYCYNEAASSDNEIVFYRG
jgi:cytoplasmic iron level regulating protein YaaA (DUF328/UPF0246 family)